MIFTSDPVSSTTSDDDENEFYDAQELSETDGTFCLKIPPTRSKNDINGEGSSSESEELNSCETEPPQSNQSLQVCQFIVQILHTCPILILSIFFLSFRFLYSRKSMIQNLLRNQ